MDTNLTNFIKYCLGYIKLTRQRTFALGQKTSVEISDEYFGLLNFLNGDTEGKAGELVDLAIFYSLDPKKVTEENRKEYEKQKALASKIEDIYNKFRNDPFTKQNVLNFGFFEIELPMETDDVEMEQENGNGEGHQLTQGKIDRYPLFSVITKIEKEEGKYVIYPADQEVQVNVSMLEPILGENLYYQLVEQIGKKEVEGGFSLPISKDEIFYEVWHKVKDVLRHTKATFAEESFNLNEVKISLTARSNYFLAEDLQKLSKLAEEQLKDTCLLSWVEDDELNTETAIPEEKNLYFPFLYDKYKLRILSVINNKASIIQGPPGTGKSETIANLLCHLAANNKKVLFVSQKAQALKVVKDKLKKLDVKYLFGYIPNPNSAQLGEEDETDGIGPQLAGLNSHREKTDYERDVATERRDLSSVTQQKDQARNYFNNSIEAQRKAWQLVHELKGLERFDIAIQSIKNFNDNFSSEIYNKIVSLIQELVIITNRIAAYSTHEDKEKFDKLFLKIDLRKGYVATIHILQEDVTKTGYDRHSKFRRNLNNSYRKFRLGKVRDGLPREIVDVIDRGLKQDISRNEALQLLEAIHNHCQHYEDLVGLDNGKNELGSILDASGLSGDQFDQVSELVQGFGFGETKDACLRVNIIKYELAELRQLGLDANESFRQIAHSEDERREIIAHYIQNIINKNLLSKWTASRALREVITRLGKAFQKSRKAFKTFDNIRKEPTNFLSILDLIPIWIMELDDASRIIPLEAGLFDYVILDEASQCNVAYTLPVMFRSKKAIFVGDSEQMRDSTIMFKSNQSFDELARRYSIQENLQIKPSQSAVQSVLDIASLRGFLSVPLRYHYRSPKELIGFSNQYFYKPKGKELIALNSNYLTYQDTDRIMLTHIVKLTSEEFSDNVSVGEAKAILKIFKELRLDERYSDKSIGILTFFNAQAAYIRKLFEDEGLKEEKDNYKVSIIEGIQGDEKDIVFYSFVLRSLDQRNRYMPLTGEGGDIRGDINRGRVNVAFSRARLQVHCFTSVNPRDFPEKIWIKKYLDYVEENGKIDFYSTDLKKFDSYFEEEFYYLTREKMLKQFRIQNQVESCGFRMDFVITNTKNNKKIAIECDGPTHFQDEIDEEYGIYVKSDEERQAVLEAAGWSFYRVKYLDWLNESFERSSVFEDLKKILS